MSARTGWTKLADKAGRAPFSKRFKVPRRDLIMEEAPPEPGRADLPVGRDAQQRVPPEVQGFNARPISGKSLPRREIYVHRAVETTGTGMSRTVLRRTQD
jgi:hypothetical protein